MNWYKCNSRILYQSNLQDVNPVSQNHGKCSITTVHFVKCSLLRQFSAIFSWALKYASSTHPLPLTGRFTQLILAVNLQPKSWNVCVISSKLDIREVIPAKERHRKNKTASTRPNDPTVENRTGILKHNFIYLIYFWYNYIAKTANLVI